MSTLSTPAASAFAQTIEKHPAALAGRFAACLVLVRQLVQQHFLGVDADGAGVIGLGGDLGVALDDVQQLQRRIQALRGPCGVVGHVVGEMRLVNAGHDFVVRFHHRSVPQQQVFGIVLVMDGKFVD